RLAVRRLFALGGFAQEGRGGADDAERRGQMDSEDGFPLLVAHLVNDRVPGLTGVVDDDVQAAELFIRAVDDTVGKGAVGDIADDAERLAARRANGFYSLFRGSLVNVAEDDARAVRGKQFRRRAPDAAPRAGDDGNSACKQSLH